MEMDIPLPEELEWLESAALQQDEEEALQEDEYEEDIFFEPSTVKVPSSNPFPRYPSSHSPSSSQTYSKRPLPEEFAGWDGPQETSVEEKRRRVSARGDAEEDEEWFRYTPFKDTAFGPGSLAPSGVDEELVDDAAGSGGCSIPNEVCLSRFASEIEGNCIPVTGPRGDRVYAKVRAEGAGTSRKKLKIANSGLLAEPVISLIERVEHQALKKALQENTTSSSDNHHATDLVHEQLWVEKYAPRSFTELLSDEQTNREVLLWLKQWDSCVFGFPIQATSDDVLSSLRRHSVSTQHQKPFGTKLTTLNGQNSNKSGTVDAETDDLNGSSDFWSKRSKMNNTPEQKVLLLCGPPGLGKTTLAHVAARHSGYHVVEVIRYVSPTDSNASLS